MTNKHIDQEVAIEVAWHLDYLLQGMPRASARHLICQIAEDIIAQGLVNSETEDIDEVIGNADLIGTYLIDGRRI